VVIDPLAGARGYRKVQRSKRVGFSHGIALGFFRHRETRAHGPDGQPSSVGRVLGGSVCVAALVLTAYLPCSQPHAVALQAGQPSSFSDLETKGISHAINARIGF